MPLVGRRLKLLGSFPANRGLQCDSSKSVQFPLMNGEMLFLISIRCMAYLNGKMFGLLFHPPLRLILLKRSSTWPCANCLGEDIFVGMWLGKKISGTWCFVIIRSVAAAYPIIVDLRRPDRSSLRFSLLRVIR